MLGVNDYFYLYRDKKKRDCTFSTKAVWNRNPIMKINIWIFKKAALLWLSASQVLMWTRAAALDTLHDGLESQRHFIVESYWKNTAHLENIQWFIISYYYYYYFKEIVVPCLSHHSLRGALNILTVIPNINK